MLLIDEKIHKVILQNTVISDLLDLIVAYLAIPSQFILFLYVAYVCLDEITQLLTHFIEYIETVFHFC